MNIITRLRRFAAVLAGLGVTMAAFAAAAAAASASTGMFPDNGGVDGGAGPVPVPQAVVVGGMPGWQIALIAIGAAVAAAVTAVLLDRMRSARRSSAPPPPETTPMNANAQAGSTIEDHAPAAPATARSGLIVAPVADHLPVTALVARAKNGDKQAWEELVDRYTPLIWSICRRYRLRRADANDVGQGVWLRLVDQLGSLRDPAGLPGWLTTTTQRECGRVLNVSGNRRFPDNRRTLRTSRTRGPG